jgi:hypothetical protein
MDTQDSTHGTVFLAFAITLLYTLFWRTGGVDDWAAVATLAEAVSPAGTNNLGVPLLTAGTLYLLVAL